MKRWLWFIAAVLLIVIIVALLLVHYPGYVLLQVAHTSVAMPLWMAVIGLILLVAVSVILWKISILFFRLPMHWREFWTKRRWQKLQSGLEQSLRDYIGEDWRAAEKGFVYLAEKDFLSIPCWLMAARAAHNAGRTEAHLDYLNRLDPKEPQDKLLVEISKVDALLSQNNIEEASSRLVTLEHSHEKAPMVLKRLYALYEQTDNAQGVLDILPRLQKAKLMTADEADNAEVEAHVMQINNAGTKTALHDQWKAVSRRLRKDPSITAAYEAALQRFGSQ